MHWQLLLLAEIFLVVAFLSPHGAQAEEKMMGTSTMMMKKTTAGGGEEKAGAESVAFFQLTTAVCALLSLVFYLRAQ